MEGSVDVLRFFMELHFKAKKGTFTLCTKKHPFLQ